MLHIHNRWRFVSYPKIFDEWDGHLQYPNREDERDTEFLPRRDLQPPDDMLRQPQQDDIRNEVDSAARYDDSVVAHTRAKYERVPYFCAWRALEDFDESAGSIEQNIEPDNSVTRPEEGTAIARRHEYVYPLQSDAGFQ